MTGEWVVSLPEPIRRALISVSDKTGLAELGAFLAAFPLQHRVHSMHCRFRAEHPTHGFVWRVSH